MDNLLTFDVEEWFHANYDGVDMSGYRGSSSRFQAQMDKVFLLCSDAGCKATFFVLGCIAEEYPDVVREMVRAGHEVASHGTRHELAYRQSYDEFKTDVKQSITVLEDVTGKKVLGYRAPSWSIVESNRHYLTALEELGLRYDASIFPVKTFLYGIPDAPTDIHKPQVDGRELALREIPTSVLRLFGRNIGYSGGFYFRLFPLWLITRTIAKANEKGRPSIVYLHPRELDPAERRLSLPLKERFIQYHNLAGVEDKMRVVLEKFHFTSIANYLELRD